RGAPVGGLPRQVEGRRAAGVQPALRGDLAVAGVDADGDAPGEAAAQGGAPLRGLQGAGAEDDAGHAPRPGLLDVLVGPQAATELARPPGGGDDGADAVSVDRPALAGAVEIDEVEVGGALPDPAAGHLGGVVAEDGLPGVIALPQPHAPPAAQV